MHKAQVALEYITAFLIIAFVLVILTYLIISYDYAHRTVLNFISKEISCQNYTSILSSLYISSKHIKFDFNSDENFFILKDDTIMLGDLNFTPSLLADENFESGTTSGGKGWLTDWQLNGDAAITTAGTPHSGSYHLRLRRSTGYAERSLSLKNATYAKLYFWRKLNSFEANDKAFVKISCNKTNWKTIFSYADGDDDNIYHLEEYDLNAYLGCENFYIAFDAAMSNAGDYFYIDDLNIFAEVKK